MRYCGSASSHHLTSTRPRESVCGVGDVEPRGVVGIVGERERRIPVGAERAVGVEADAPGPAQHADVEVEEPARIAAGEQDREERDDGDDHEGEPEEREHDEVRDREEPLDQPQPAAEAVVQLPREVQRIRDGAACSVHGTHSSRAREKGSGWWDPEVPHADLLLKRAYSLTTDICCVCPPSRALASVASPTESGPRMSVADGTNSRGWHSAPSRLGRSSFRAPVSGPSLPAPALSSDLLVGDDALGLVEPPAAPDVPPLAARGAWRRGLRG